MDVQLGSCTNGAIVNRGPGLNSLGIKIHTCLYGFTDTGLHNLVVLKNDRYYLNNMEYGSLKEAMESITSLSIDWKTFWKTNIGLNVGMYLNGETNE